MTHQATRKRPGAPSRFESAPDEVRTVSLEDPATQRLIGDYVRRFSLDAALQLPYRIFVDWSVGRLREQLAGSTDLERRVEDKRTILREGYLTHLRLWLRHLIACVPEEDVKILDEFLSSHAKTTRSFLNWLEPSHGCSLVHKVEQRALARGRRERSPQTTYNSTSKMRSEYRKYPSLARTLGLLATWLGSSRNARAIQGFQTKLMLLGGTFLAFGTATGLALCDDKRERPQGTARVKEEGHQQTGSPSTSSRYLSTSKSAASLLRATAPSRMPDAPEPARDSRTPAIEAIAPSRQSWQSTFNERQTTAQVRFSSTGITIPSQGNPKHPPPALEIGNDGSVAASIDVFYFGFNADRFLDCAGAVVGSRIVLVCPSGHKPEERSQSEFVLLGTLSSIGGAQPRNTTYKACGNLWIVVGRQTHPWGSWCFSPTTSPAVTVPRWFVEGAGIALANYTSICKLVPGPYCTGIQERWRFLEPASEQ